MSKHMDKDLRLWDKGNSIIPFITRSMKLAKSLMKTVSLKRSIIESFEAGKILKTNSKNPLSITQEDISEIDEQIITDLWRNGLLVYHVLVSDIMIGVKNVIQCENAVSTYESVISTNSYICVPKDIFSEAKSLDEDNENNRELVIQEYKEHEIFMAKQGYLYAYVVNDDGSSDFYYIGINILNGELLRVS